MTTVTLDVAVPYDEVVKFFCFAGEETIADFSVQDAALDYTLEKLGINDENRMIVRITVDEEIAVKIKLAYSEYIIEIDNNEYAEYIQKAADQMEYLSVILTQLFYPQKP